MKKSVEWETPNDFFKILDDEFHFTLDVAASIGNAKCRRYYTEIYNALLPESVWAGETFWMNPPYGRGIDVYS